ncbi:MAG TPA: M20/M25/M40 family metallo-hydrolase [Phycisphaerales bacterium]|nr:M20/M25/M40 family metallo-hydrolase [Phycisphaerales bacterium]
MSTVVEPDARAPEPRRKFSLSSRGALRRLALLGLVLLAALAWCWFVTIRMPGRSWTGPLPPLTETETRLAGALREHVEVLAGQAGSRSLFYPRLQAEAASYIRAALIGAGFADTAIAESFPERGTGAPNLEAAVEGTTHPNEIIVIGAHYDAFQGTPGADDNASGVAALLELARSFRHRPQPRTLRFVFFTNEEPPAFQTSDMGSWVYAKLCRGRADDVRAMLSLESIGYYSEAPGSQKYPFPFGLLYPSRGDFIGLIGNYGSRALVRRCVGAFRASTHFPCEGAAMPSLIPGVGWSDQWAFWQEGYPALMVTCTAPFRNPHYHQPSDKPDTLDFERTARVVAGLERLVIDLSSD